MSIVQHAIKQFDALFPAMCASGAAWHLYRMPGSDQVALMHESAQWDVPAPPVLVPNVHAMTREALASRVHHQIRFGV